MKTDFILASSSPQRQAILTSLKLLFDVIPAHIDESVKPNEDAMTYVQRLALEKAEKIFADQFNHKPVLGADTCVVLDEVIFGKPENELQAFEMLKQLSGKTHQVLTAVAIVNDQQKKCLLSKTEVSFNSLTDEEIHAYVSSGEPMGKAGAYAIQGLGGIFISHIHGSYSGVVGLPVCETAALLKAFSIPIIHVHP